MMESPQQRFKHTIRVEAKTVMEAISTAKPILWQQLKDQYGLLPRNIKPIGHVRGNKADQIGEMMVVDVTYDLELAD
jgi:hypothetical protein